MEKAAVLLYTTFIKTEHALQTFILNPIKVLTCFRLS